MSHMNPKERLDVLVAARGLAESREQAQRLIMAGDIRINGQPATKAGQRYPVDVAIERVAPPRFVSRGGEKLEGAFAAFPIEVAGLDCLDVGASTGGFTDCMLQHGAARVTALDVGHGQLHEKMRRHPQVTAIEGFNARYMTLADLPYRPSFATADVSFISLKLILPRIADVLVPGGQAVTLIKPQFEAGRAQAPHGVVRDPAVRQAVCDEIRRFGTGELHLEWLGIATSPITGPQGNVEFLAWWRKPLGE